MKSNSHAMHSPWKEPDDEHHYCRLFAPSSIPVNPTGLNRLGEEMVDPGGNVSNPVTPGDPEEELADSGYTYFGQFLDHDLTEMDPLPPPLRDPQGPHNLQTPRLDLSHLYGGGPAGRPGLYSEDKMSFRTGQTGSSGRSFDVYVDPTTNEPVLADMRSGENVMIREITAVFARLHNAAVRELNNFDRARQKTSWQFQYLVVEDYLNRILDPDVFQKVFKRKKFHFEWKKEFSIPLEFAGAAMRFGHSMVRPNYLFLFPEPADQLLKDIFDRSNAPGPLEPEWEIVWGLFFQGAGGSPFTMASRPIDTLLAPPLHKLTPPTIERFTVAKMPLPRLVDPFILSARTLLRGGKFKLASGQAVAKVFKIPRLTDAELLRPRGNTPAQGAVLKKFKLLSNTPLWYYILKESEARSNGSRIGPVGSSIIAETIAGALRSDPHSYWNSTPPAGGWPPEWKLAGRNVRMPTLTELFFHAPAF